MERSEVVRLISVAARRMVPTLTPAVARDIALEAADMLPAPEPPAADYGSQALESVLKSIKSMSDEDYTVLYETMKGYDDTGERIILPPAAAQGPSRGGRDEAMAILRELDDWYSTVTDNSYPHGLWAQTRELLARYDAAARTGGERT